MFVSSLEIRWYSCVLRLPKQKNLLVLGRRFSASGVLLRRGAPTEEYCRIVSGGQQSRQSMPISRKNRCTLIALSIAKHQRQEIVQNAFKMAIGRNPNRPKGAVYHSDRGSQYTAKRTKRLIEQSGFRKSMSRPGTPSDNQPIESFWKTLECEMTDIRHLTFEEAERKIVEYIELYYNSERLHSGINYSIPNQFFTLLSVRNS